MKPNKRRKKKQKWKWKWKQNFFTELLLFILIVLLIRYGLVLMTIVVEDKLLERTLLHFSFDLLLFLFGLFYIGRQIYKIHSNKEWKKKRSVFDIVFFALFTFGLIWFSFGTYRDIYEVANHSHGKTTITVERKVYLPPSGKGSDQYLITDDQGTEYDSLKFLFEKMSIGSTYEIDYLHFHELIIDIKEVNPDKIDSYKLPHLRSNNTQ